MKRDELEAMTVKDLRLIAAERGIPKATKLSKAELVAALSAVSRSSRSGARSSTRTTPTRSAASSTRTKRRASYTAPAPTKRKGSKPPPGAPAAKSSSSLLAPVVKAPAPAAIVGSDPGLPVPEHYGHDRLVLMVQDPHHVFAYWELQPETVARVSQQAQGTGTPVLAIHSGGGTEYREVDLRGGNYYLAVGPDQDYEAELALRDRQGTLHTLARSNKVHTPTPSISSRIDEQWMGVDETFHELLELAGLPGHLRGAGSAARLADQRRMAWSWQHSGVTSLSSQTLSSHSLSSTSRLSKP
jgi:hypothetical protein